MKNLYFVALALVVAGCVTDNQQNTSGEKPTVVKKQVDAQSGGNRVAARQVARCLRTRIKILPNADSAADKKLVDTVSPNVQKALCDAGCEVVYAGDAELEVSGSVKCLDGAMRGNRTVCRGYLELTFKRKDLRNPVTGKELGRIVNAKRFDAKSGEAWTQEEALMSLGDALSAQVGKWVRESFELIAGNLALCDVSVSSADGRTPMERGYPTKFTNAVLGIPGVYFRASTCSSNA